MSLVFQDNLYLVRWAACLFEIKVILGDNAHLSRYRLSGKTRLISREKRYLGRLGSSLQIKVIMEDLAHLSRAKPSQFLVLDLVWPLALGSLLVNENALRTGRPSSSWGGSSSSSASSTVTSAGYVRQVGLVYTHIDEYIHTGRSQRNMWPHLHPTLFFLLVQW